MNGTTCRLCGLALLVLLGAGLVAGPAAADERDDRISRLEQQVQQLTQELEALRRGGDGGADVEELARKLDVLAEELERLRGREVAATVPGGDDPEARRRGLAPSAAKVYRIERGISIGGYGELLYENFDDTTDAGAPSGKTDRFDLKRLIVYLGYKFNDRVLFNSEIEYEHALAGDGEPGEVAIELAYLDFLIDPRANVRAGMVLVPVGFINELHEPPTFFSADRPQVERNIIPTTWRELGVGVFGESGRVSYRAYLTTSLDAAGFSSSSGIRGGRQSGAKARAEDLALSGRLDVDVAPGLLVGVSAFTGKTGQGRTTMGGTPIDGDLTLWDVHAEWRWKGLRARGLWASIDLDDADLISDLVGEPVGSEMSGWYLEAGWDVLWRRGGEQELIPFVRRESFDTLDEVPAAFAGMGLDGQRDVTTIGVVYKPIPQVAVKLDFQNFDTASGSSVDQWNAALGFMF
ncbi:MAG: hypothetical protein D6738_05490 [Acidobacteria bacterium]|nr:MAG: hypothetical protein D6738_05490 [Acidobacteriota bacterium]